MQILGQDFLKDEIEEISLLKDLCDGMIVDGNPLICFEILDDIFQYRNDIKQLPKQTLLVVAEQLKAYNSFWENVDWYDNRKMEGLLPKLRKIVMHELTNRKL
jgi:hypothetical protein